MKSKLLFLSVVVFAASGIAQEPDSGSALKALVEAERSFAYMSVGEGARAAFVANLAENCLTFRDTVINAHEMWSKRKAGPTLLTWMPEYADIAASGDFGYTTGPWVMSSYGPQKRPSIHGYYVSIWKKQADGQWKNAFDVGLGIAEGLPANSELRFTYPKGEKSFSGGDKKSLTKSDEDLNGAWNKSSNPAGYFQKMASGGRMYRDSHYPSTNPDSILTWMRLPGNLSLKTMASDLASSGDLGYTYGSYASKEEKGLYFRIWKRQSDGSWKIVIDLFSPKQ